MSPARRKERPPDDGFPVNEFFDSSHLMNLTAPSEVKALLSELDFRPNKILGQNFLIDSNILKILLTTANLRPDDAVIEIGPGLGVLTERLIRQSGKVIAIEKDKRLVVYLKEYFRKTPNLELIEANALDVNLDIYLAAGFNKIVANLPYSVASRLLVNLAEAAHRPEQMVVTVQNEVANRLIAAPGTNDYGLLSVLMQLRYEIDIQKEISPSCFFPPPEVKSAIVNLVLREPAENPRDYDHLKELLKLCFSKRRKQLGGILRKNFAPFDAALSAPKLDPRARAETLSLEQWVRLSNALCRKAGPPTV
jgi:16S rRNA (adenine1518-N6/adenine1519-N6)-dimethyltransferase